MVELNHSYAFLCLGDWEWNPASFVACLGRCATWATFVVHALGERDLHTAMCTIKATIGIVSQSLRCIEIPAADTSSHGSFPEAGEAC